MGRKEPMVRRGGSVKGRALQKKKARKDVPTLVRHPENPLISPREENEWEAWQTFNPGAIVINDRVHFLYRAIGKDGISRFGYASSGDGFHVDERLPYPVYEHRVAKPSLRFFSFPSGGGFGGAEDPRIVRVDEEPVIYVTYTACDNGLSVALTSIRLKDFLNKRWAWRPAAMLSPPGEVHKNWVIFPEKIGGKYAILHSITPNILIDYLNTLDFEGAHYIEYIKSRYDGSIGGVWKGGWEGRIRGVGPPPIKTKFGWLVFYHALERNDFSKYKLGAMLLDLKDPKNIICRSRRPVLEPKDYYELNGFKPGVIYASGAVVKDGKLLIYYGGADSYVCVAYANLEEFLERLTKGMKPKVEKKRLKRRIKRR